MNGIQEKTSQPVAVSIGESTTAIQVDTTLYELDAVLRACYRLTDRCYLFLTRDQVADHLVNVSFMSKGSAEISSVIGEFCNDLLDQSLRIALSREFGSIRELIVAQAFAEGNLLDHQRDEGDYATDPLGIGERR